MHWIKEVDGGFVQNRNMKQFVCVRAHVFVHVTYPTFGDIFGKKMIFGSIVKVRVRC